MSASVVLAALMRELGSPLESIRAVTDLLTRQVLPPDAAACLRTLKENGERLARALAQAEALSGAETMPLRAEPTPLRPLLDGLEARWSAERGGRRAVLTAYDGDGDLAVLTDGGRLEQVFDGLVRHALGLTRRGAVEATLTARVSGRRVHLTGRVRDSGATLTPERLAGLFEPGSGGLELAACAALVRRMGGAVRAAANPGQGLSLTFELDLPQADGGSVPEAFAEPRPTGVHVLIVDDNATNRLVAEAFCEMFGCTSDMAEDGVEALEAVSVRRYDLILMDIKMPRMDGVEATLAIRARPGPERDTPIIALTANADPDDVCRYLAVGMRSVVEKPIKADRLAEALASVSGVAEPVAAAA